MLKKFAADLHIHTCLSPCADIEMTPSAIVKIAAERGIDMIAITDHNAAQNVTAAIKASENLTLKVLAGMEITSAEEAHILALFDDIENVFRLQDMLYEDLQPGKKILEREKRIFGDQIIVNEKDEVLGFNNRQLIAATELSVDSVVNNIHALNGLAIASHVDKSAFSILSQLGFIPEDLRLDALEMSLHVNRASAEKSYKNYNSLAWITSSDAHYLRDIGRRLTYFYVERPTLKEMSMALENVEGRYVEWE